MIDVFADAEARYLAALADLEAIRQQWEAAGRPLTTTGSTGQEVIHPLRKELRETEGHVTRLGEVARRRHSGPDVIGDVRVKLGRPPSERLKAVK